jgi:hypothetical protein
VPPTGRWQPGFARSPGDSRAARPEVGNRHGSERTLERSHPHNCRMEQVEAAQKFRRLAMAVLLALTCGTEVRASRESWRRQPAGHGVRVCRHRIPTGSISELAGVRWHVALGYMARRLGAGLTNPGLVAGAEIAEMRANGTATRIFLRGTGRVRPSGGGYRHTESNVSGSGTRSGEES